MSFSAGMRLGPYEISAPLGAGGMGEVYRARDTRLAREVALKVLPDRVAADAGRAARFEQEARAASALNHPNIVSVFDFGSDGGVTYLVTELVDGEPLRALIENGPVAPRKAIDIAAQIADGLAAAHTIGLVHRDLKPGNIMLTRDGRVKILDFGLAKYGGTAPPGASDATVALTLTEPGVVMGTAGYMSPEQVRGANVDGRSDIFAFGSVLYEMLVGKAPFAGSTTADVMGAVLKDEPADLPASVPAALEAVVRHCLEKNADTRFQSARDLAFALKALSAGSGISTAQRAPQIATRGPRRRGIWMTAVAVAALLVGGVVGLMLAPRRGLDLDRYRYTPLITEGAMQWQPAWSPDGRKIAFTRDVKSVSQVFVRDLSAPVSTQITNSPQNCNSPYWSPDSTRVYYHPGALRQPRPLYSAAIVGGEPQRIFDRVLASALSPDGRTLAMLRPAESGDGSYDLMFSSPPGATPKPYSPALFHRQVPTGVAFLQFAPNGKSLLVYLFNGKSSEFSLLPLPAGSARAVLPSLGGVTLLWSMSWMPDSRRVVLGYETRGGVQHLHMADLSSGATHAITSGTLYDMEGAVSPDGTRLAVTVADFNFDLVRVALDGSGVRPLKSTSRDESAPAWSPARPQYAYVTNRNGPFEIWIANPQDDSDRPLVTSADFPGEDTAFFGGPAFSPDGNRVAYTRRGRQSGLAVWISPVGGGLPARLNASEASQYGPAWSPDGRWIAYFSTGGGMPRGIVKARVGGQEPPVFLHEAIDAPRWSPDGAWISALTADGLALLSPDGKAMRVLHKLRYEPHCWAKDSSGIYGIVAENGRTRLDLIAVPSGAAKTIADLGPDVHFGTFAQFQNPLSLAPDGKSLAGTLQLWRTDIWMLEGFDGSR